MFGNSMGESNVVFDQNMSKMIEKMSNCNCNFHLLLDVCTGGAELVELILDSTFFHIIILILKLRCFNFIDGGISSVSTKSFTHSKICNRKKWLERHQLTQKIVLQYE